jgi:hypothetical protein
LPKVADNQILNALQALFSEVIPEWLAAKESEDAYNKELMYSPRLDFAVGPFNRGHADRAESKARILAANAANERMLDNLKSHSFTGSQELQLNGNPRCFLAIEIERETSRKHRLGGMINASSLGLYGIMIAPDAKVERSLVRIRRYLDFLGGAGKLIQPRNILVITKEAFLEALRV